MDLATASFCIEMNSSMEPGTHDGDFEAWNRKNKKPVYCETPEAAAASLISNQQAWVDQGKPVIEME